MNWGNSFQPIKGDDMKKKLFVLIGLMTFLTFGCIDVTTKIKLKHDGSGTIEETILMSGKVIEMLAAFSDESDSEDGFNLYDEEKVKLEASEFGTGVTFIRGEEIELDGKKGYRAYYSFEDISRLTMSSDPSEKMPDDGNQGNTQEEKDLIKFSFKEGSTSKLEIFMPIDPEEINADFNNEAVETDSAEIDPMLEQFKDIIAEMRIAIELEIEGDIIATNASHVDGNKITMLELSFKKLFENPEQFKKLAKAQPDSYEETKELLKDIPGFKFELNEKVFVEFD